MFPFFPVSTSSVSQLISNCGDVFVVSSGSSLLCRPLMSTLSLLLFLGHTIVSRLILVLNISFHF